MKRRDEEELLWTSLRRSLALSENGKSVFVNKKVTQYMLLHYYTTSDSVTSL